MPAFHVVAGVLEDEQGRVLVAQRPGGKVLAGAWEFPGGKLHQGERRIEGLVRELREELGIDVDHSGCRPLIQYRHAHDDFEVLLDVWTVRRWHGPVQSLEHQALEWRRPEDLLDTGLLTADAPIVKAIQLPCVLPVTPTAAGQDDQDFIGSIEILASGLDNGLVCLRRPDLEVPAFLALATAAARRLEGSSTKLLLHGDAATLAPLLRRAHDASVERLPMAFAGIHMPSRCLETLQTRPLEDGKWLGVSCHDEAQLARAQSIGADYALLGPVKKTTSHPGQPGMGWQRFEELVRDLPLPVYAIGGLGPEDLETAWAHGAQGIAAIRSLWPKD